MAKPPGMSADFARGYADLFMDEGAKRDQRWKGVTDVARTTSEVVGIEVLCRLAFQTAAPASGRKNESLAATHAKLIPLLSGGEVGFDPAQSAREIQFLAAAALERMFVNSADAALAVSTTSFGGRRKLDLPMDLAGLAERALVNLSAREHVRQPFEEIELAAPKVDFQVSADAVQSMAGDQWQTQFDGLRDAANAAIARVVTGQNRVVEVLHKQITLGEEELQMLWWLIGGFSHDNGRAFAEVDASIRPLVLAHELGGLTTVSPGPASIRAMMLRAGVGNDPLVIGTAVNAVDIAWAKSVSESALVSPASTPLHFALEQRSELGSDETWQAGWSALTGLSVEDSLPAATLAELFYREHVLINVEA